AAAREDGVNKAARYAVGRWVGAASCVGVFGAMLAVYLATMRAGMSGGDAMEFARCACSKSVPHPPGYPLWTWMLRSLLRSRLLSWMRPVHQFNVLAAVVSALACALLHQVVAKALPSNTPRGVRYSAAWLSAVGFGLSPTVWLYANQPEVFALNNAFCALLLYLTLWVSECPTSSRLAVAAFASGLALSNHHAAVLYIAPVAVLILTAHAALYKGSVLVRSAVAFAAGFVPFYVWLGFVSGERNIHSWGDLTTPGGLLRHILRLDYGGSFQLAANELASPSEGLLSRLLFYCRETVFREMTPLVAPLAIVGTVLTRSNVTTRILVICFAFYILFFHTFANLPVQSPLTAGVVARFWMQPNMILFVLAGIGFARAVPRKLAPAAIVAVAALGAARWSALDFHNDTVLDDFGRALLERLPRHTMVLLHGDLFFNLASYLHTCEWVRPDVRLISMGLMTWRWFLRGNASKNYPGVSFPGERFHAVAGGFTIEQFLDANLKRMPIVMCGPIPQWQNQDYSGAARFHMFPFGACSRIFYADDLPNNMVEAFQRSVEQFPVLQPMDRRRHRPGSWELEAYETVHQSRLALFDQMGPELGKGDPDLVNLASRLADSILGESFFDVNATDMWHAAILYGVQSVDRRPVEAKMYNTVVRLLQRWPDFTDQSASAIAVDKYNPWRRQPIQYLE
ncbi:hypothetical protein PBRA_001206, partial [Plasmodiophora brassicae]